MFVGKSFKFKDLIKVAVNIGGEDQPLYMRAGDGKLFVAGIQGQEYSLTVVNQTDGRIEVLNSVDGQDTLKNQMANLSTSTGMVIGPRGRFEFKGFRSNDDSVGAFVFDLPVFSVANQVDQVGNRGVIGFAVFQERAFRADYLTRGPYRGGSDYALEAFGAPVSKSMSVEPSDLGTGIGRDILDPVGKTSFNRASDEPEVLAIGYATAELLERQGIIAPPEPDPFPGGKAGGYGDFKRVPSIDELSGHR
jgi:hypothetical protein